MTEPTSETGFLTGRTALVTGGARRIGAAIARELAELGAAVVVHYGTSEAEAFALVDELRADGRLAYAVKGDLADAAAATGLVERAEEAADRPIDILINNAAIFEPGGVGPEAHGQWARHEAVNLRAPFLLAHAFAARLPNDASGDKPDDGSGDPAGDILNLNDIRALRPGSDFLAYTASKVGLHGLTKSLAQELAPRIRVNEIALGAVLPPEKPAEEYDHVLREAIPLRKFPTVEQVTDAILFLLYNEAMTGQTICIDGGQHLR